MKLQPLPPREGFIGLAQWSFGAPAERSGAGNRPGLCLHAAWLAYFESGNSKLASP